MHDVLLTQPAATDFKRLAPALRSRALDLMREIRRHPSKLKPTPVYSSLLDTTLYMVRKAGLRLFFEIDDGRAVILSIGPHI